MSPPVRPRSRSATATTGRRCPRATATASPSAADGTLWAWGNNSDFGGNLGLGMGGRVTCVRHHHPPRQMVPDKGRPRGRLGGSLRRLPARRGDEEGRQPVGLGGQLLRSPRSARQHQSGRRPDRGRQRKGLGDRRGRRRLLAGRQGRRQPVGHRPQHVRQPRPRRHRRQASADSGRRHQGLGGRLGRSGLRPGPQEGRQPLGLGREQLRSARGRRHYATAQPDAGRQRDRLGGRPPASATTAWR